jgi:4-amino-4-deoxy-L-arabinose transferase-like glycosyltransferase
MQAQKWLATHQQQVVWILAVGLVFRSMIAFWLHPGFDEVYYYIYTKNPAWSYFDHPPLVALSTGFGIWLTGEVSQFTIRLGSLLLYTGTLLLLYFTSAQLFSTGVGVITLAIATIVPIFQIGFGVLTLPDAPLMFFWMATLWVAAQEFFPSDGKPDRPSYRLAVMGLLVGCACLGKYHGLLLGGGLLGFCLTHPLYWRWLRSPWMLLSLGLFLLAFAPVLYWNGQHDWASFRYQGNRGIPDGYHLLGVLETVGLGIAYLFPTLGVPLWWVNGRVLWRQLWPARPVGPSYRLQGDRLIPLPVPLPSPALTLRPKYHLILWIAMPAVLGFTLIGGYQQVLPTWPMPGFFTATLLLGDYAARWQKRHPIGVRRWLVGSAITIAALLLFALLQITAGTLQKNGSHALFGGFIAPAQDATRQLVDVQQLRRGIARSPDLLEALQSADFVFSNRFYLAGQVGMAIAPLTTLPITSLDGDLRGFAYWSKPSQWIGQDGIYITSDRFVNRFNTPADYTPYFKQFTKLGEVLIRRGGKVINVFHVYRGEQMVTPFPRPYGLAD